MALNPKTPSHRRGRSDAQTPLTPSLVSGLNSVSLVSQSRPTKRVLSKPSVADLSNPFIARPSSSRVISKARPASTSRPVSPVKRATSSGAIQVTDALSRQANNGVIRKGGVESRMNVVTHDYVPPPKPELLKSETKRSRSTPSIRVSTLDSLASIQRLMFNLAPWP